MQPAKGH